MKYILTIFSLFVFGQTYCQVAQFSINHWTNESHYNPAASGFLYKHLANINYRIPDIGSNSQEYALSANYGLKLGKHHGLGVNYGQTITEGVINY